MSLKITARLTVTASVLAVAACADSTPIEPAANHRPAPALSSGVAQDRLAQLFATESPAIMAMPGTVFADHDEAAGKLVFGIHNANAAEGIQRSLEARGVAANEYEIRITEPIVRLATLRDRWRPTQGGIQIHFGGYLCTMGFNVDHAGGRSFITNSHCTNTQGGTEGTTYYQPVSSVDPVSIATEAADPQYVAGGGCSLGKVCRWSDASRALYNESTASSRGVISKTTGVNTSSITVDGAFSITAQDNTNTSFSGTVDKVGRTTGWTRGTITNSCVTVNVSGSNVQLRCQTLVTNNSAAIVNSGDSGSPVFQITSGDNVTLVGILWGGSGTSTFVFSPLKNIQDELGPVVATSGGGEPPPPPPSGSVASFTRSCSGFTCTFDGTGSTGETSYSWNFGDGGTSTEGPVVSHTFAPKSNNTVTLSTQPAGPESTTSQQVNCNPKRCQ